MIGLGLLVTVVVGVVFYLYLAPDQALARALLGTLTPVVAVAGAGTAWLLARMRTETPYLSLDHAADALANRCFSNGSRPLENAG